MVEMCIKLAGHGNYTAVCDPFSGYGHTLIIAKRLGIKGIGIDIDKKYFDNICRRVAEK